MGMASRFSAGILVSSSVLEITAILVLLLLILILIACSCKPWCRVFSVLPPASVKVDDIERPLISEDPVLVENLNNESVPGETTEQSILQSDGHSGLFQSTCAESKGTTHQLLPSQPRHGSTFPLHSPNTSEDSLAGVTLKRAASANHFAEEKIRKPGEDSNCTDKGLFSDFISAYNSTLRSTLVLAVISGPSSGCQYSFQSKKSSTLQVSIGRVSPGDVILKDSEVSGKHAMIRWNVNKFKWELIDTGSLNGTILNGKSVQPPRSESRRWSDPFELSNGDTITLGTSSKILVHITSQTCSKMPFGIGKVSDSMSLRQGGKKLPMEDVCFVKWPLPGLDKFGIFGIYDGHGGADAATSASKIMPEAVAGILSHSFRREKVLSYNDASDVLREAFYETDARINHCYEGCTATVLLVWVDDEANFFLQCANVGDSACVVSIGGTVIKMTEDHRITSHSERIRIQALGPPLRDGETRICGMNLARMLGDKFLKEQDARFSSEPYISDVTQVNSSCIGFVLLASDGFWDVINVKRAIQLVHQAMEMNGVEGENRADKVANMLLAEARTLRTKDNTSILFLDFTQRCKSHP